MAGGMNLASKYSSKVDERFYKESQAMMATNNEYKFTGEKTVNIYSIPTVPMNDYTRSGSSRYGTPTDLTRNVQSCTITKDRSFTFIIDKGDKIQSEMVSDAGKSLSRQIREVCVPEYDTYVFAKLAAAATAKGNYATTQITASNAYAMFLQGEEFLGNHNVPDKGRVAFCSYRFANFLKQDPSFMKYSNMSQEMVIKGVLGECDGIKIVKVPSSRLPAGCAFIITHPSACTAPKQLTEYKTHDNPPGISGWLVEGRLIYDAFILNEKANAVYYHGSQPVLKLLNVTTAATDTGKTTILVEPGAPESASTAYYYQLAANAAALDSVAYGSALTSANWTSLSANGLEVSVSTNTVVAVVEADASYYPIAYGTAIINKG